MATAPIFPVFSSVTGRSSGAVQAGLPMPNAGSSFSDQISQALNLIGSNSLIPTVPMQQAGIMPGLDLSSRASSGDALPQIATEGNPATLVKRGTLTKTGSATLPAPDSVLPLGSSLKFATMHAASNLSGVTVPSPVDQGSKQQSGADSNGAAISTPEFPPSQPNVLRAPVTQTLLSSQNPPTQTDILLPEGKQTVSADLKASASQRHPVRKIAGQGASHDDDDATTPTPQAAAQLDVFVPPNLAPTSVSPAAPLPEPATDQAGPPVAFTRSTGSETVSLSADIGSADASSVVRNGPDVPSGMDDLPQQPADGPASLVKTQLQARSAFEPESIAIDAQIVDAALGAAAASTAANATLRPTAATPANADRTVSASETPLLPNGPRPLQGSPEARRAGAATAVASDKPQHAAKDSKAAELIGAARPEAGLADSGPLHILHAGASAQATSETQAAPAAQPLAQPTPAPAAASHAPPPLAPSPVPQAVLQPLPSPPSAQLGSVFAALTGAGNTEAPQSLVIRLDPLELGKVEVRIDRSSGGPARVELAVERTDTLMSLLQDRPQLDKALDQAGVPTEGRTLQFSLSSQGSSHGSSASLAGFGPGSNGGSGGHGAGHGAWGGRTYSGSGDSSGGEPRRNTRGIWLRDGIDITA